MELHLAYASEDDASCIADIYLAAFANNRMLQTQFPTPEIRAGLWHSVVRKILADIRDPHIAVLVIWDVNTKDGNSERQKVISYAVWNLPTSTSDNETPWEWPEGTRLDILEELKKRLAEVEKRILGNDPSYRLTYLATHPAYQRQGAGAMLVRWAFERCKMEQLSAYVESTSVAENFYKSLGFELEDIVFTVLEDGTVYDRIAMAYRP